MSGFEQIPFGASEFAENPEPRCPCLLLLDTSTSMAGSAIDELNHGLMSFKRDLSADPLALKRVEISMLTFGPVQLISDFQHTWRNATPGQGLQPRIQAYVNDFMNRANRVLGPIAQKRINAATAARVSAANSDSSSLRIACSRFCGSA